MFSNVLVESKAFVQTFWLGRKTVPGHFGFEATLLFKHFDFKGRFFVKHFGFKASLITFCFEDLFDLEQDLKSFCKIKLVSKQDFCSIVLISNSKQGFTRVCHSLFCTRVHVHIVFMFTKTGGYVQTFFKRIMQT